MIQTSFVCRKRAGIVLLIVSFILTACILVTTAKIRVLQSNLDHINVIEKITTILTKNGFVADKSKQSEPSDPFGSYAAFKENNAVFKSVLYPTLLVDFPKNEDKVFEITFTNFGSNFGPSIAALYRNIVVELEVTLTLSGIKADTETSRGEKIQ